MFQKWCQNFSTLLYITTMVIWKKNFMSILHQFNTAPGKKIFFQFLTKYGNFRKLTFSGARNNVLGVCFELEASIMVIFDNFRFHFQIFRFFIMNWNLKTNFHEISWNFNPKIRISTNYSWVKVGLSLGWSLIEV